MIMNCSEENGPCRTSASLLTNITVQEISRLVPRRTMLAARTKESGAFHI